MFSGMLQSVSALLDHNDNFEPIKYFMKIQKKVNKYKSVHLLYAVGEKP